jgi:hypothetical protein
VITNEKALSADSATSKQKHEGFAMIHSIASSVEGILDSYLSYVIILCDTPNDRFQIPTQKPRGSD